MADRVLLFEGGEEGHVSHVRFEHLFRAVVEGPLRSDDGKLSEAHRAWDTKRADGKILRKFKAISVEKPTGATNPQTGETVKERVLRDGGGDVRLTGDEFKRLEKWWERVPWHTYNFDEVEDCFDWWQAAPKAEKASE